MSQAVPNLSTTFCGVHLPNPFLLSSAPPTAYGSMIKRAFAAGWGGAVIKTMKPDNMDIQDVTPRFAVLKSRSGEIIGFENIELITKRPVAVWLEEIREIKQEYPDRMLIASIMSMVVKEGWQDLAKQVEAAGADAIELNFSCPHGMPERGVGAAIGQSPEVSAMITEWVKEAVSLPVMVKLTPNVTSVAIVAKAVYEAGADALAAINTIQCLMGVDLETHMPQPSVDGLSTFGGYSGLAVKPVGLRVVAQLRQSVPLPISGIGGIGSWEHAAEYMLLGAGTVQVCTEVMLRGYGIIDGMVAGLQSYLARQGFRSVDDLVGLSIKKLAEHGALTREARLAAAVDPAKCVVCGLCARVCDDAGYEAIRLENQKIVVDPAKCDGCSLCTIVCPKQAMSMR